MKPASQHTDYTPSQYREALDRHGVVMSYTAGVSMRPLIWQGHHYVAIVPVDEPQVGDMLLFEQMRQGKVVCVLHRLVKIEHREGQQPVYTTRGDNCLTTEKPHRQDIIGRATDIYRVGQSHWYHAIKAEHVNVGDKSYRRYVKWLNATWPVRYLYYKTRSGLSRIKPLRALYRKIKNLRK